MKNRAVRKVVLICLVSLCVYAQDTLKTDGIYKGKNAVYVQLGGKCGVYSLNYERYFFHRGSIKLSYNIGFCVNNFLIRGRSYIGIPIGIYLNIGKKKGQFSVGFHQLHNFQKFTSSSNITYQNPIEVFTQEEYIELKYSLSIGYRHLPLKKGIFYSIEGMLFSPSIL